LIKHTARVFVIVADQPSEELMGGRLVLARLCSYESSPERTQDQWALQAPLLLI
jgi:hypothetical protein